MAILVILMMFAFSMQLMSIAPTYLTFGDQKDKQGACSLLSTKHFHNQQTNKKSLSDVKTGCTMTMISELYMKMQLSVPLFSIIYYLLTWVFIGTFLFFVVYHAIIKDRYKSRKITYLDIQQMRNTMTMTKMKICTIYCRVQRKEVRTWEKSYIKEL